MQFRNSRIVITTGFVLVLALMIALVVIALSRMAASNQRMEQIAHRQNVRADLIFSMGGIVRERSLAMYAMLMQTDPFERDEVFMRFNGLAAEFIELRGRLNEMGLGAEEQALLGQALALIRSSQPLQEDIVRRILNNEPAEVNRLILHNDLPLEREIIGLFDRMAELQRQQTRAEATAAAREYGFAYLLIVILSIAATTLGAATAFFVVRRTGAAERALFQEKEEAQVTLHSVGDAVITADALGRVLYLNPVAEQLTGWTTPEAAGRPLPQIYHVVREDDRAPIAHPAFLGNLDGRAMGIERHTVLVGRDGREHAIEDTAAPIRNDRGGVSGCVLVFRDVTATRNLARQLGWQASHDGLTGLVNRREFEILLGRMLDSARLQDKQHALLYLDLDQFKLVNDTCGHVAGDELLKQLALLLQSRIRDSDTLARLGGDEFGVLLEGCPPDQAERIANSLREVVQDFRFVWQDKTFSVGVSIGLVNVGSGGMDLATVMSAADAACYLAKDRGRNRVWVHKADDADVMRRHGEMEWTARINAAFSADRFCLYKQAVVANVASENPTECFEVFIRMLDEQGRIVLPMAFIPAAERYGLMPGLDRWVVRKALAWLARCDRPVTLAINLSGQSLGDEQFLEFVLGEFGRTGVDPKNVCFEITETAAIANLGRAQQFIGALKARGCSFALDDFGSGMSSFAYLKGLAVDFIKIDGTFVKDMAHDVIDSAMVEAVNRIGHVMGIKTIAEFVENDAIRARLKELGVDFVQGYGIHRPEPL